MRRLASSAAALVGLLAGVLGDAAALAQVRSVQLVQQGGDFAAGRLEGGLSLRPGGLRADGAGVFLSATVDAGLAFSAIGAHWLGAGVAEVELSVSPDGVRWGRWIAVPAQETVEELGEDGRPNPFAGEVVGALVFVAPSSRYLRYRVRLAGEQEGSGLRRIGFHVIDPGAADPPDPVAARRWPAPPAEEEPFRSVRAAVKAPGPPLLLPDPRPGAPKPAVASRAAWGARPPKAGYTYTLAGHLAIHHTATVDDFAAETWEECAARVRAIQTYHMDTNGWNDLGYAYLICRHGHVFQAREDDDDSRDVQGAHDGLNRGSTGLSVMGYFHPPIDHRPTDAQVSSLADLVAWIAGLRGIDPLGRSLYEAYGGPVDNVYGHREVKATDCPGDHLFSRKGEIRATALDRMIAMPL